LKKYLFILNILFASFNSFATTTSGSIVRNINVADGFVEVGNTPQVNSTQGQWETDERFEGYNSLINWYLSWDENNLYIGKIGGNNSQGALLYIRADYTGATYSNQTIPYDDFNPGFSPMNGVNFSAYIKDTYDEFRTFDTLWSNADSSLNPAFGNFSDGNHLEVAIPWNSISHGNGKPQNIRIVFYQVDNGSSLCNAQNPTPFLYGASPWGTGDTGNGPSIAVNDGQSVSNAQPDSCNSVNAVIARWWGCYPVLSGVGPNEFVATQPNAGNDVNICSSSDTLTLQGNEPAADAVGTWSIISSPINANAIISDTHQKNALLSGLNIPGEYILIWDINYGGCSTSGDTVVIKVWEALSNIYAGNDQLLACGNTNSLLAADSIATEQNYVGGIGYWTTPNNDVLIVDSTQANTGISNLPYGETKFIWHTYNTGCSEQTDTMKIVSYAPINATSIDTLKTCSSSIQLIGNDAGIFQNTAIGIWSLQAGNANYNINNTSAFDALVSNLIPGNYTFEWKISNGNCTPDSSETYLVVSPTIYAGNDSLITLCNQSSISIHAMNPDSIHPDVYGLWSLITNQNLSFNTAQNVLNVDSLSNGDFKFQWKLSNGYCASDSVVYTFHNYAQTIANAGVDQLLACNISSGFLAADSIAAEQNFAGGKGYWTSFNNDVLIVDSTQANAGISNLPYGETKFIWHTYNTGCPEQTDTMKIVSYVPINATTIDTLKTCSNSIQLIGNDASIFQNTAIGVWSLNAGIANYTINNASAFDALVSNLLPGDYSFEWKVSNGNCAPDSSVTYLIVFPIIDAGSDSLISLCNQTSSIINAIDPGSIHPSVQGVWSILTNQNITFNTTQFALNVDSLIAGEYQFQWKLSNGYCASDSAVFTVQNFVQPFANAGIDTTLCSTNNFELYANAPATLQSSAIGIWSVMSGNGNITSNTNYNSSISNFNSGELLLKWTMSNGNCADASDTIKITIAPLVDANTSGNISVCDSSEVHLNATATAGGQGVWQIISGNTNAIIDEINNPTSILQNLNFESTTLQWKVSGYCNVDSATIVINNYQKPQANAGIDGNVCKSDYQLLGNNPLNITTTATGLWSIIAGDAVSSLENPTVYNSKINNLKRGDYTLRWTVQNGACEVVFDEMKLLVNETFNFGNITKTKGKNEQYVGILQVGKPFFASEPYQLSIDEKGFTNDSIFDSLSVGKHYLQLLDYTGCLIDSVIEIKPELFIPTGISPNDDRINDTWEILGLEDYTGYEIKLFNLWGQKIYESISKQDFFDGTYLGGKLPDGDYYYIIDLKDGSEILKGKLTVLR
jgi:large repetitive protein